MANTGHLEAPLISKGLDTGEQRIRGCTTEKISGLACMLQTWGGRKVERTGLRKDTGFKKKSVYRRTFGIFKFYSSLFCMWHVCVGADVWVSFQGSILSFERGIQRSNSGCQAGP